MKTLSSSSTSQRPSTHLIVSSATFCSRNWKLRSIFLYGFLWFLTGNWLAIGFPTRSQRTYVTACKPNIDDNGPGAMRQKRFKMEDPDYLLTEY